MGRLPKVWWLGWLLVLVTATGVAAQGRSELGTQPSAYWRYDAPGPLHLVTTADLNGNGIDEFVVTTEEGQLLVLGADGRERWSHETRGRAPIRLVTTLNVDGAGEPMREVLLATDSTLTLLAHDGQLLWRKAIESGATPAALQAYAPGDGGPESFLLALSNGLLRLYDGAGEREWQFPEMPPAGEEPQPQLATGDVDGDGQDEIAFSYFDEYTRLSLLRGNRQVAMARSLSGQVTALAMPAFGAAGNQVIAVGKSFRDRHEVQLYNELGEVLWLRTPNRPVTRLATARLPQGEALLVGTSAGTAFAYDGAGRRLWRFQPDSAARAVVGLAAGPYAVEEGQAALVLTLAPPEIRGGASADVILLDNQGQRLLSLPSASGSGQSRLVDSNRDGVNELLLAGFGTISLTDPGTGARKNAPAANWPYRVSQPQSMLVADLDGDEQEEILVGAEGLIHLLESGDARTRGQLPLGGAITELALAHSEQGTPFIVATNVNPPDPESGEPTGETWIELWQASGRVAWTEPQRIAGTVTALAAGDLDGNGASEVVAGSDDGRLRAFSLDGDILWEIGLGGAIQHLLVVDRDDDGLDELVAVTADNEIYLVVGDGRSETLAYYNLNTIDFVQPFPYPEEQGRALVLGTRDGMLRALTWEGLEVWQRSFGPGPLALVRPADDNLLIGTADDRLHFFNILDDEVAWTLDEVGGLRDVYWGDLDGGGLRDIAVGNANGNVLLLTSESRRWDQLALGSSVFRLAGVRLAEGEHDQLVTLAQNGVVQLFEAKPNRPPLLVEPEVEAGPGQYVIRLAVIDEAADVATIVLETWDEGEQRWAPQRQHQTEGGGNVSFIFSPSGDGPVHYRFVYDDGTNQGTVTPPPGPAPQAVGSVPPGLFVPAVATILLLSGVLLVRQTLSTQGRTGRFYGRLKQQQANTLELLDAQYTRTRGSPDFLLSLANRARRDNNVPLANLANGLFLLATRPEAALPIITGALQEAQRASIPWRRLDVWQATYEMGQMLLEAPTITELGLLRPRLLQLVHLRQMSAQPSLGLETLLRVLAALRDSERVELADDRLVYLHEATLLLNQMGERIGGQPPTMDNQLVDAVVERLHGLVRAEMEVLRGQAQLQITLMTKRLVAMEGEAVIALEIENQGRAAAENVVVMLEEDPAYAIESVPQTIPVLWPGRSHQVNFRLAPTVKDRFRVAFRLRYDDRIRQGRRLAFADMVHLLPPVRSFEPIRNPYTPGTPLRGNSPLFYGREGLFEFIAQNMDRIAGRNVLILVGQRRTGKTSALLRLDQHLPAHIFPVYIDCQSLGVLPGMAALLHDIAWLITDTLGAGGYEVAVGSPEEWRDDPSGRFQRHFVPALLAALPAKTTVLLVFDEFEVFENLVADGILPSTFFTFMRHLMQHTDGLGFVFVGSGRLEEMGSDYWSVLFNIALYKQIGFLSREAATRLICEPVAPHIVYDDLALEKIWRVTAGQPYFLQLVCYTLVKRANQEGTGYVTISDVNAALDEMLRLGEVHFAYLWQRSSRIERALLAAVAHLMDREMPFHPSDLTLYLEQYGFRFEPAEVTAGLTRLVEREIMREIRAEGTALYELKIGLVGLWAARNKSLTRLYESGNGSGTDGERARRERA
ncbi:MAG: AAA family ATPase [Anaerolineae bacterium]|nr:AAA family ATPase [Anaerolineae bacterium]